MNVLTVADCHGKLLLSDLNRHRGLAELLTKDKFDIALFLGDNNTSDIECVQDFLTENKIKVPCYGILGNHDSVNVLENCGIGNIHLKTITVNGITIGGFGGSIRYNDSNNKMLFTHEESLKLLADFPICDVFITHSNPQFYEFENIEVQREKPTSFWGRLKEYIFEKEIEYETVQKPLQNTAHSGLIGIGEYIDRCKPKYHIHGHLHQRTVEMRENTKIECCYGVQIITV